MRLTARQAANIPGLASTNLSDFIWLKRGTYQATQGADTGFFPATPDQAQVDVGMPVPENLAKQLPAQNPAGWYPSPEFPQYGDLNPGNFFGPGNLGPQVDGARPGCCEPKAPGELPYFTTGESNALEAGNAVTTAENLNLDPLWMTSGSDYQNVDPSRQWGAFSEDYEASTDQFGFQGMSGVYEATSAEKKNLEKLSEKLLLDSQYADISALPAVEIHAKALLQTLDGYQYWKTSQVLRGNAMAALTNVRIRTRNGSVQSSPTNYGLGFLGATIEASSEIKERLTKQAADLLEASKVQPVQMLPAIESAARGVQSTLANYTPWTANFWNYYESSQVIRENTQAAIQNIRIRQGAKQGTILNRSEQDLSPTAQMAAKGYAAEELSKTASNVAYATGKLASRVADASYNITTNQGGAGDKALDVAKLVTYIIAGTAIVGVLGYAAGNLAHAKEAFGG